MKSFIFPLILSAAVLSGCALSGKDPLATLFYPAVTATPHEKNLLIFLRGKGGSHKSFEEYGFIQVVQEAHVPCDMVAVDAHFGYYLDRTLDQRLKEDVIDPARAKGYKKIWLAGVSMGGLGAILYTLKYPGDISGIILISPFLGFDGIRKEITSAGGLQKWEPGLFTEEDWERLVWARLKSQVTDQASCPMYLGYGASDEYMASQALLGHVLPANQVKILPGGHSPTTFQRIWKVMVRDILTTKLTD